jgi:hypothetical protein
MCDVERVTRVSLVRAHGELANFWIVFMLFVMLDCVQNEYVRKSERMANYVNTAPQWSFGSPQDVCAVCTRPGSGLSSCGNHKCTFRAHQRCFKWWKGSSATGECPCCKAFTGQPIFPIGARVVIGAGNKSELVTVCGFSVGADGSRMYTVSTSNGMVFQVRSSELAHMPVCRVCSLGNGSLEFNPCRCRGSILQFVHRKCLGEGATCPVCDTYMEGEVSKPSAWDRVRDVFRF